MILAIDTATRWAGLALHSGTAVVAEYGWHSAQNHTVELAPALHQMCYQVGIHLTDLTAIAVAIGPGSYTGLRVGLALAKGLSLANKTPLIGISTLDIVAASLGEFPGPLLVAAEAGRTRVCVAEYRWRGSWQMATSPDIKTWEDALADLRPPALIAGEITPAAARLIRQTNREYQIASPAMSVRRAGFLAELGWKRYQQKQLDDAASLAPVYLRDPAGKKITASPE
ncbi:MAG: tRNA (adenosine(37)-N6)-threonylcarbamoyltransferase complex dimerization subunit type 1 TsaB [Chloroflexi bacterium]|nr:MAG: tRNA (adenosine(37)-N6)-threonylcarbamoyltransferase complex dimerization subunit type 1 TsaB [Chloroflexota bacterium]